MDVNDLLYNIEKLTNELSPVKQELGSVKVELKNVKKENIHLREQLAKYQTPKWFEYIRRNISTKLVVEP